MRLISTNITSPLGMTTESNYTSVLSGSSALSHHEACRGVNFPFEAALFSDSQWESIMMPGHTRFESLLIRSLQDAIAAADINTASDRTLLIISTTKGDILTPPGKTATNIANAVGVRTTPIVVCNACISGLAAQVLAMRMLNAGFYDTAIVTGGDVQTDFVLSGFQSLKALSPEPCRPFDIERLGLNLGEAAATMIFTTCKGNDNKCSKKEKEGTDNMENAGSAWPATSSSAWHLVDGAIRNDAYHISGPHPKGDGCLMALQEVTGRKEDLALVGVHGTATMYNDQMESKAIERAGLSDIPISALKGYYGHTLGAAGLLETIMTARALDDGIILPSKGYSMRGVSGKVSISNDIVKTEKREFIKMLSGFGGCNAAVRLTKLTSPDVNAGTHCKKQDENIKDEHMPHSAGMPQCSISSTHNKSIQQVKPVGKKTYKVTKRLDTRYDSKESMDNSYKKDVGGWPQYHKMDLLSRAAFLGSESLLATHAHGGDDTAVILFNYSSSLVADKAYIETMHSFPSPSLFVRTLPNISTSEVALRHGLHGETSFYILPCHDDILMEQVISASMDDRATRQIMAGWIECPSDNDCDCRMMLVEEAEENDEDKKV